MLRTEKLDKQSENEVRGLNTFSFIMPIQPNSSSGHAAQTIALSNNAVNEANDSTHSSAAASSIANVHSSDLASKNETKQFQTSFDGMNSENMSLIFKNTCEDINKKRAKDSTVSSEFHSCITQWANEATAKIIEAMYKKFQDNAQEMSSKLELIERDIESIAKLEEELKLISTQVESLYNEIKNC